MSIAPHTQSPGRRTGIAPKMACPHCGASTFIRSSEGFTVLYREATYQCQNVRCGCTFVAGLEVIRILSPSGIPNPSINLPMRGQNDNRGDARPPDPG
jgi:Ogr/Delta-like zinc finger